MKKLSKHFSILFIPVIIVFFICQASFIAVDSDYSNLVLEANDILHGNVFLRDWNLTGLSFFTTDLLYFIIAVLFGSVSKSAIFIATGLMSAVAVILGYYLCESKKMTVYDKFIYLFLCLIPANFAMLSMRAHTGAVIWAFFSILLLQQDMKQPKLSKRIWALILLSLGYAGDPITLILGILPLALYCFVSLVNQRLDLEKKISFEKKIALCVVAVFLGTVLDKFFFLIGGANKNSFLSMRVFEPFENWHDKTILYFQSLLSLGDASFMGQPIISLQTIPFFANTVLIILGFILVFRSIWKWLKADEHDFISVVLSIGFLIISLLYIITDISVDLMSSRYIATYIIVFAVLIVRNKDWLFSFVRFNKKIAPISLMILLIVSFSFKASALLHEKKATVSQEGLAAYLEEKELQTGFASFWNASSVTVLSHGNVKVRAIIYNSGFYDSFNWFCKNSWYKEPSYFVISDANDSFGITPERTALFCGSPTEILHYENYEIYVYESDISGCLHVNCLEDHTVIPLELYRNAATKLEFDYCLLENGGILYEIGRAHV